MQLNIPKHPNDNFHFQFAPLNGNRRMDLDHIQILLSMQLIFGLDKSVLMTLFKINAEEFIVIILTHNQRFLFVCINCFWIGWPPMGCSGTLDLLLPFHEKREKKKKNNLPMSKSSMKFPCV